MRINLLIVLAVVLLGILVACAPKAAPVPAPSAVTPTSIGAPAIAPASKSAAETEWDKVVEAAKKEGKVNIYSYNLVGDIGIEVARVFKDKYGVTVDIITGRGAEILERMKTEKRLGKLTGDLHDGSSVFTISMKTEGLTMRLAELIPVFQEQGVWKANVFGLDSVDKHVGILSVYYQSPWINTKLVTAKDVPEVWKDLLTPQWKGKMILTDPTTSGGPQQFFVPLIREKVIDENYLISLYGQDIMFATSLQDEARVLARGDRPLSIRGTAATYGRFAAEGAPIKAIDIKDGVVQVGSPTMVGFAGGPHPNATRLFINWFFSKEGQTVWTKAASTSPVRSDVPDAAPQAAWLTPQKPVLQTMEDNDKAAVLFREKWPNKLWGR